MISISFDCSACCNILWNDICISFLYVFKNKLFYSLPKNMLLNDRKKHYKLHFVFAQHSNNYNNHPKYISLPVQVSVRPSACLSQWVWRKIWGVIYACKKTISKTEHTLSIYDKRTADRRWQNSNSSSYTQMI